MREEGQDALLDKLRNARSYILDMDGTVYLGRIWIDGARRFLDEIERAGKEYFFLTNNASKNPNDYVIKLGEMGLPISRDRIVTSGEATIAYIKEKFPGARVFLLGNDYLKTEFREAGIRLDEKAPDLVVTSFDTTLDYAKMCRVCDLVREGLPYISTHPDYNCPTETGFIPDSGAIHAFIHASSFRYPDKIIGKPNREIVEYLIRRVGADPEESVLVGDRIYTDIAAGKNYGILSALVLSGETKREDIASSEVKPDLVFESVKDMIKYL